MATFLLIPGAGGAASYWSRVAPLLEARGHRAIAVELPSGDPAAGVAEYADAAAAAVDDARDLVVVGQSMGGFTAPVVAQRLGARLIVLVNAMTPRAGESMGEWWGNTGSQQAREEQASRDGRDLDDDPDLIETFFHDVPADVREASLSVELEQTDTPFVAPWPLDAWPDIPTRFVQGVDDRFFPIGFQRRVVADRLGIEVEPLPGGHLIALSRPVELAARLHECWRDVAAGAAT